MQQNKPFFSIPSTSGESGEVTGRLRAVAAVILAANERMNLTADREADLFWQRHIADATAAAARIEAALGGGVPAGGRVLDVGAGGGIPGLVWAVLWPQARVDLMESRLKRVEFLREAARELGLTNVRVLEGRAEELGHQPELREQCDLVTARALAPLPTLLELCLPFVRVGGWLGAIKSAAMEEELAQGRAALAVLDGAAEATLAPYARGDGKECAVCLVRKQSATAKDYPRRPNLPERRPLGAK
jgi:16S rRNA (guanine527-N7)-methyltransferase